MKKKLYNYEFIDNWDFIKWEKTQDVAATMGDGFYRYVLYCDEDEMFTLACTFNKRTVLKSYDIDDKNTPYDLLPVMNALVYDGVVYSDYVDIFKQIKELVKDGI